MPTFLSTFILEYISLNILLILFNLSLIINLSLSSLFSYLIIGYDVNYSFKLLCIFFLIVLAATSCLLEVSHTGTTL